jgi:phospholipid transport system transporter-binding protein
MAYIVKQANGWRLSGDLQMDNANAVLKESELLPMYDLINIDFSDVNNIDTAALALMLAWVRRAKAESCQISYTNVPDNLNSLANLYGVQTILNI